MTRGEFWRWFIPRLVAHLAFTVVAVGLILKILGIWSW